MSSPRSFADVVDEVISAIPDVPDNDYLVNKLARLRIDSWFQPPESRTPWLRLVELLEATIGEPSQRWHHQVVEIVAGQSR